MPERPILDMWVVEIVDAEGVVRRVRFLGGYFGWRQFPTEVPQADRRAIQKGSLRGTKIPAMLAGMCLGLFSGFMNSGIRAVLPSNAPVWMFMLIAVAAIPVLWLLFDLLFLRWFRRRYRPRYIRTCLEQRRCPFCMYSLSGLEESASKPVTCPECSGRWTLIPSTSELPA